MGFLQAYKRLDNLCRDMNGKGVTGYIEDMQSLSHGAHYVPGWTRDYAQLKRYRYIRNQIVHENYADEDNMCSDSDVEWIEEFHQRILVQEDPLACYYKVKKTDPARNKQVAQKAPGQGWISEKRPSRWGEEERHKQLGYTMLILCVLVGLFLIMRVLISLF